MGADGFANRRRGGEHRGRPQCNDSSRRLRCAERLEGTSRCGGVGHDNGQQGLAHRCFRSGLPACIDLDQFQQGPHDAIQASEPLGSGSGPGAVERHLQCIGAGSPTRQFFGGHLTTGAQRLGSSISGQPTALGGLHLGNQRRLDLLRLFAVGLQPFGVSLEPIDALAEGVETGGLTPEFALTAFEPSVQRAQLAAHLGRSAGGGGRRRCSLQHGHGLAALGLEGFLLGRECLGRRGELSKFGTDRLELGSEPGSVVFQVRHDACVHQLAPVALHRSASLDQHRRKATGTFTQLLHPHQLVADIGIAPRGQFGLGGQHIGIEPGKFGSQRLLGVAAHDLVARQRGEPGTQRADLTTGQEHFERLQFANQVAVTARRFGLTLERAQLPSDLSQQILDAQQAGLGGIEAPLGFLLASPVLQHTGGFFDDRSSILGPSIQHCVDLTLADDHVLLTADPGIAEQLLHVEQAAGNAVDRVFALAGTEQRAADGDLRELDGQQASSVVEGEHHLGATKRRPLGGAGKDDVVHLLAAHSTGRLCAQNPGNGVDNVGFARAVGTDHNRHARFELHHGGVGERLEAFEGQCFEEHGMTRLVHAGSVHLARYFWQRGQNDVDRPADITRRITERPQVMQGCPSRS
ncbi:unannotated protein [freshwater metagenome]|uniref:Unannotated protein n=1 Tax=freshwater metagenome TaxID=449393 RepID=A0A6J7FMQ0_9ZZZZ